MNLLYIWKHMILSPADLISCSPWCCRKLFQMLCRHLALHNSLEKVLWQTLVSLDSSHLKLWLIWSVIYQLDDCETFSSEKLTQIQLLSHECNFTAPSAKWPPHNLSLYIIWSHKVRLSYINTMVTSCWRAGYDLRFVYKNWDLTLASVA